MPRNRLYRRESSVKDTPQAVSCAKEDIRKMERQTKRKAIRARLHKAICSRRKNSISDETSFGSVSKPKSRIEKVVQHESYNANVECNTNSSNNTEQRIPDEPPRSTNITKDTNKTSTLEHFSFQSANIDRASGDKQHNKSLQRTKNIGTRPKQSLVWVQDMGWVQTDKLIDLIKQQKVITVMQWRENSGWVKVNKAKKIHKPEACVQHASYKDPVPEVVNRKSSSSQKDPYKDPVLEAMNRKSISALCVTRDVCLTESEKRCEDIQSHDTLARIQTCKQNITSCMDKIDKEIPSVKDEIVVTTDYQQKTIIKPSTPSSPRKAIKSLTRLRDLLLVSMGCDYSYSRKSKSVPNDVSLQPLDTLPKISPLDRIPDHMCSVGLFRRHRN